jgi:hypothetical protein
MLNSKKLVYGDGKVFDKFSVIPLSKAMTSMKDANGNWVAKPGREKLHNMRVKMEQFEQEQLEQGIETVAMVAPLSALKMMKKNITLIDDFVGTSDKVIQKETKFFGPAGSPNYMARSVSYEVENSDSLNKLTTSQVMELDANFMGLQVLNPSNKAEIIDPTQIKTLLTGEQQDNEVVILNGEEITIGQIRALYNNAVAARLEQKYLDKRNLVFNFDPEYAMDSLHKSIEAGAIQPDLVSFLQYAKDSLLSSQTSPELIEFFSFDEVTGEPNFDLNNPITEGKFKQLFLTFFTKGVMAEKIPGTAAALLSDYGFSQYRKVYSVDQNGYLDRQEIIRTDDFAKNYSMEDVQMHGDGPLDLSADDNFDILKERVSKLKEGEYIIVKDRLRPDMKEYDSEGNFTGIRYTESLLPAHSKEVYEKLDLKPGEKIPDVVSKMFGIRIPSQDNHSTVNIKVVDFLPVFYGSTIVSARELVEVSGADFDIDKLYMQMKEYYTDGDKFVEYKDSFEDYIKYINKQVQKKGSTFAQASAKGDMRDTGALTNAEKKAMKKAGFSFAAIDAVRILGLPKSQTEYNEYKEKAGRVPFAASYNNEILDYKFALMGNRGVTESTDGTVPVSYEAADMEILKDIWNEISTEIPELAEELGEDNVDTNNLMGKNNAFGNNKEGAKSIGAAVLPNLYLSLMQEVGLQFEKFKIAGQETGMRLIFNGIVYDSFDNKVSTREILEDGTEGRRKQYIISALITAMTDNAKERLAAKLGLSRNALAIVTNMTAMGVPIKTSILLVKHPAITRNYKLDSQLQDQHDTAKYIADRIAALKGAGLEYGIIEESDLGTANVNQELLKDAIKDRSVSFDTAEELRAKLDSAENPAEFLTKEQIIRDVAILQEFMKAFSIAEFLRPVGDILNLAKGFGKDTTDIAKVRRAIKSLSLDLTDEQWNSLSPSKRPMIDLRKVFTDKMWQTRMLDIFEEFTDSLMPKVFLNESLPFNNIFEATRQSMSRIIFRKENSQMLQRDLLSYVTLKAYTHWLATNPSPMLGMPVNTLIYPEEGQEDIVDVYDQLKELAGSQYNYFLDGFLRPERAKDEGNKTGISMLTANTLTPLNDSQKIDLQNGFRELFADPKTRHLAMKIINYIIVKDGMQLTYRSLLSSVSPEMFGEYLATLPGISQAFASMDDTTIKSVFGLSFAELKNDFLKNYGLHPKTAQFVKQVTLFKTQIYQGKSKIKTASGELTRNYVQQNPNKLFVIFDNESKTGASGSKIVRDEPNVVRIVIKKGAGNTASDHYSEEAINEALKNLDSQVEEIKGIADAYDEIIFQPNLDKAEIIALQKNSPLLHDDLITQMQDNFGYSIQGKTKTETKAEKVNIDAKKKAMFMSEEFGKATLTIDLLKGIAATPNFDKDSNFIERPYKKIAGADNKKLQSNFNALKGAGLKSVRVVVGNGEKLLVTFPSLLRVKVDGKWRYFQLVRHAGYPSGNINEDISVDIASGTFAQYIEVDVMGSPAQNPIGWIFGNTPTNTEIQKIVRGVKGIANDPFARDADITYEFGTIPALDQRLETVFKEMDDTMLKGRVPFENWINTPAGKKVIKEYLAAINDPEADVSFENGEVKVNGENLENAKGKIEDKVTDEEINDPNNIKEVFTIPGTELPGAEESTENADEGLEGNGDNEKLQEFWDSLTIGQKNKLKEYGITNFETLVKEGKKDGYKNIDDYIEQLKQCF